MAIGNVEWPTGKPRIVKYEGRPPNFNPYTSDKIIPRTEPGNKGYNPQGINIYHLKQSDLYSHVPEHYSHKPKDYSLN